MIHTRIGFLVLMLLLTEQTVAWARAGQSSRDHLTAEEAELVRDAQLLDVRMDVFIKAAERRVLVLKGTTAGDPKEQKKDEKWGELPKGTRAELIDDIAKIFDEAITNIDDVSSRDPRNGLIPKALRKLAAATTRIMDQLKPLQTQAKGDVELGSWEQLTENAESILQAANKLPPPASKTEKGKADKNKGSETPTP